MEIGNRCYRAPEVLFGARTYTGAVDIWGAGCVLAEMLLKKVGLSSRSFPVFLDPVSFAQQVWLQGYSDLNQLEAIFRALGTPTAESWPEASRLPNYCNWESIEAPPLG